MNKCNNSIVRETVVFIFVDTAKRPLTIKYNILNIIKTDMSIMKL